MKTAFSDLGVVGSPPAFDEARHVGRPNIPNRARFLERINEMLDRRWLTNGGPFVRELEAEVSRRVGVKHCIAVCNATVGLEVAARAAGLTGEVIVPAFTFAASAHAMEWIGLRAKLCDVDRKSHNIDPADAERRISPRVGASLRCRAARAVGSLAWPQADLRRCARLRMLASRQAGGQFR